MDISDFKAGLLRKGNGYSYFLPEKINVPFSLSDNKLTQSLETASLKLGELNSCADFIPDIDWFILSYEMKEALTSSRIEGTRTNMEEIFTDEKYLDPEAKNNLKEVIQYAEAMKYALGKVKEIPLSNRIIKETHKILLKQVRGERKEPGEFRRSQNWIGGISIGDARFVPPAHEHVPELMSDLEKFLHNSDLSIPHLIKIAIAHYQFETIHPFLDGNGRIGRLLIPLYLVSSGVMEKPLLYISDFFEKNKTLYLERLTLVRTDNDLKGWLEFFLQAVFQTAQNAISALKAITDLRLDISTNRLPTLGKRAKNGGILFQRLFSTPVVTARNVAELVWVTPPSANELLRDFTKLGILYETTGYKRNRLFVFKEYLDILKR